MIRLNWGLIFLLAYMCARQTLSKLRMTSRLRPTHVSYNCSRDLTWMHEDGPRPTPTCILYRCSDLIKRLCSQNKFTPGWSGAGVQLRTYLSPTTEEVGPICFRPRARVRLSVCKITNKNACMDLDEMLRVDRCRDMDELINFWARSGS